TGVLAAPAIGGVSGSVAVQLAGVGATLAYSGLVTAAILWVVDRVVGLRVSAQAERDGLDLSQHGERVE
ncbi:MAG: ammonia channel protein, partial [Aquabacterium sp.]